MKNLNTLFATLMISCCMIPSPGHAQRYRDSNSLRYGIKGGVNFASLYTKDGSHSESLTSFNLGVFSKFSITHNIAVQPEVYFTVKGAEITYNTAFVDGTARFRLNYIEFPLLLVVNITDHFNIHAGPYGSFLVRGNVKNISNINLFNFEQNIDSNDYNRFDGGLVAGAGIDLGFFSLGARYNYGLTNVGKEKTYLGISYTVPDASNGVISLYISVSLN